MEAQVALANQKKRGPAPTGIGKPVMVRFHQELLDAIDAWRRKQPDPPSRPEAIRQLVAAMLQDEGDG